MIEFQKLIIEQIEYRFDPLTNEQVRINPARAKRLKQVQAGEDELDKLIKRTGESCPFCPERVQKDTPHFSKEIAREGRIKIGESLMFPNLNPFGEHHAVGLISEKHFLNLGQFAPQMIKDSLLAAKRYILAVNAQDQEARYPVYMWNYMPPSAGSIIHPHVQVLVESKPTPQVSKMIEKSLQYYTKRGDNYWKALIEQEAKLGERFIVADNLLSIIASFAPRGFCEICFIFNEISSFDDMDESHMERFSLYLSKALKAYRGIGVGSFNLITFSGPIGENVAHFYWMSAKLISRPYPRGIYTNDTGPMEREQGVWVIDTLPEELANRMKSWVGGSKDQL
jgi:galactose-1-phosphate uridylyltransferase